MVGKLMLFTLPTKGKEAREQLLARCKEAGDAVQKNEPGTLKYAFLIPRDEADEKNLFILEEYVDQAACNSHMTQEYVKSVLGWIQAAEVLEGPFTVLDLDFVDGLHFSRKELAQHADPYVTFAEIDYEHDTAAQSIPYWQAVAETGRESEPGTLAYGVLKDAKEKDKLFTVEVYESKEYLWDVHAKSKAVEENVKNTKDLRKGLKHQFLQLRAGFLHKGA